MAKAASPIRLQDELMNAAKLTGEIYHRSASEQIEYWASIGRSVNNIFTPDTLLSILSGVVKLKIEPIESPVIDPDSLFVELESERNRGTLASTIPGSVIKYQASITHPGMLERIEQTGEILVGQFKDGEFHVLNENL